MKPQPAPLTDIDRAISTWTDQDRTAFQDARGTGIMADGNVDPEKVEKVLMEVMNLSPRGIREHLQLNKPIYARTSAYGHFGRTPDADGGFSWEKTDLVDELKRRF